MPATAAATPERPGPPTAAAFDRATDRLLDRPAYRNAEPRRLLRSGGISPGGTSGGKGGKRRAVFPFTRYVTLYGAPQLTATAIGKRTPRGAREQVVEQSRPYARLGDRPVTPGFDLIGTIATASAGADGKYRTRQDPAIIARYLKEARKAGGRLVLDIQPGRSTVIKEIRALKEWILQPDVDVAIDPEWNVGPRGVPGRTAGSIHADDLNRASAKLARMVANHDLPPKLMLVHQFHSDSVKRRKRVEQPRGVTVALNFDGIGTPAAKRAGYLGLIAPNLFNGFSIFYDLDTWVMKPRRILALDPVVDFLLYQ